MAEIVEECGKEVDERHVQAALNKLVHASKAQRKWLSAAGTNVYWVTSRTPRMPPKQPTHTRSQPSSAFKTPQRSRRLKKPFSTPRQATSSASTPNTTGRHQDSLLSVSEDIKTLQQRVDQLSQEYSAEELDTHIDKLHTYNDLKDVAQAVMGMLASQEGLATRAMYERYDLDLAD
ncbi:hypothetical protein PTSG_10846 [Salpingoeca rosetta]|uniref:DNA repair protein SWI5 homolog n=1 Tax=Salpingoeca rosetta (strain ATCC 50818 / BSB-021) TaxID=946362 RepID=F2URJ5_SALR5|nr:uncharacterized protein PTSG_10846 [Salpingoeca rosetta]EGD80164.1 hypothetical protein PTSG_10846 [Salpingoeca rosetta]|eukprot:XP_004988226.1 hypothetical protein PTSG_10846 [Salpingoeca rosetta]